MTGRRTRRRRSLPAGLLALAALLQGCGDPAATLIPLPEPAALEVVGGAGQQVTGGRRSPEAFRVRALSASGSPVAGAEVRFTVRGTGGGLLSQPRAITDSGGFAETFLLEARAGAGQVDAAAGDASASMAFHVERAPGRIAFDSIQPREGLPSLPHPDSILQATLLDTDGLPLEGWTVWFAAEGELAVHADTTDASGRASTRLVRSGPAAGEGAIFAFVVGFPDVLAMGRRPVRAPARRVLLVSIEGLRGDAIARYAPPNLTGLAEGGGWTDRAESILPTLSVPAHLSMLAGVPPSEHGVHSDRMTVTQEMAKLEPLFRRARRGGAPGAAVMSREGPLSGFGEVLECREAFGLDRLTLAPPTADAALPPALEALADSSVSLVFVHLPDPDVAGHAHGWLSAEYREAVLEADRVLGILVEAARAPDRPSTLVMVTSPHGGGGAFGPFQHGSGSPEDRLVPLVVNGPGVPPGTWLEEASILDVAPTALWALGIAPPLHYRGHPVTVPRLAPAGGGW